jgi:hypothetical protein
VTTLDKPSDKPLQLDLAYADDLLHLLQTLDDILRYGGHGLREDITERYHPHMHTGLLHAVQLHACLLHHAINTARDPSHHDY